jgi:hypothetical protein
LRIAVGGAGAKKLEKAKGRKLTIKIKKRGCRIEK